MMTPMQSPGMAPPKENTGVKATALYGRDKFAPKEIDLNPYYVQSKPRLKKPENWDAEDSPEQDSIERALYGRLQDYRGRLFPLLGSLLRICVFMVLFPFYFLKMVFERIQSGINHGITLIVNKLTPPYQYCYGHAMRFYNKVRGIYLGIRNRIKRVSDRFTSLITASKLWLKVLFRYANRVLEDWSLEVKNRFSAKTKTSK